MRRLFCFVSLLIGTSVASTGTIGVPGIIYNAAEGQAASASSYYDYKQNPLKTQTFEPGNAIDGMVMQTSWWSSGTPGEEVYWLLHFKTAPEVVDRLVIRWDGYQTAKNYKVQVSYNVNKFRTLYVARDYNSSWDRIDEFRGKPTGGAFLYIRILMEEPNVCGKEFSCGKVRRHLTSQDVVKSHAIYGIREVEVWGTGLKSTASQRPGTYSIFATLLALMIMT